LDGPPLCNCRSFGLFSNVGSYVPECVFLPRPVVECGLGRKSSCEFPFSLTVCAFTCVVPFSLFFSFPPLHKVFVVFPGLSFFPVSRIFRVTAPSLPIHSTFSRYSISASSPFACILCPPFCPFFLFKPNSRVSLWFFCLFPPIRPQTLVRPECHPSLLFPLKIILKRSVPSVSFVALSSCFWPSWFFLLDPSFPELFVFRHTRVLSESCKRSSFFAIASPYGMCPHTHKGEEPGNFFSHPAFLSLLLFPSSLFHPRRRRIADPFPRVFLCVRNLFRCVENSRFICWLLLYFFSIPLFRPPLSSAFSLGTYFLHPPHFFVNFFPGGTGFSHPFFLFVDTYSLLTTGPPVVILSISQVCAPVFFQDCFGVCQYTPLFFCAPGDFVDTVRCLFISPRVPLEKVPDFFLLETLRI